jgi:hypothetical protein
MENDKKQNEQVDPDLGDWDPDYFPISPKPVFRKSFLLLFFLGALCFFVYQCSVHEEHTRPAPKDSYYNPADSEQGNPFGDGEEALEMSL